MNSPLLTLLALVVGLSAAVALVVAVTHGRSGGTRAWLTAVAVVAVASLAATWPPGLRDAAYGVDQQRKLYAGMAEWEARSRCRSDMSRTDLVAALTFAGEVMPENARYLLPRSTSPACLVTNLLPRVPVRRDDFDPRRDWTIYDVDIPSDLRLAAQREQQLPQAQRRYLLHNATFVLVRPDEALSR